MESPKNSSISYVNCVALVVSFTNSIEFWPPNTKLQTIQKEYPNCYVALVDGEFYGKKVPSWRIIVDPQRMLPNGTYFLGLGEFDKSAPTYVKEIYLAFADRTFLLKGGVRTPDDVVNHFKTYFAGEISQNQFESIFETGSVVEQTLLENAMHHYASLVKNHHYVLRLAGEWIQGVPRGTYNSNPTCINLCKLILT